MKKTSYILLILQIAIKIAITLSMLSHMLGCGSIRHSQPQTAPTESSIDAPWRHKIKEGDEATEENKYAKAEEAYKAAISLNPNSEEAHLKLVDLHIKRDEIEAAQIQLQESLKINPNNIVARNFLGYLHEKIGQNQAAAKEFEETLKVDPNNLYALNHLGLVYRLLKRLDEAKIAINKAIQLDPECKNEHNKNAYNYLSLIYEAEGDKDSAITQLKRTLQLFPDDVWTHNRLGTILENLEKYEEALAEYLKTLRIEPQNALALSRIKALQTFVPNLKSYESYEELKPVEIAPEEIDVEKIISESQDQNNFGDFNHVPEADAIILLNIVDHEINENGSSKYTMRQLIKILTDRGVALYGEISIPYNSRSQKLWVNLAHTILPDGKRLKPSPEAYHDVTPPELISYRMYSDMMYKTISMPGLKPGAIIEYQFTIQDAFEGIAGNKIWSWGGIEFQAAEPIQYTKYALKLPKDVQLNWKTYNCQTQPIIIMSDDDSDVIYTWEYHNSSPLNPQLNDEEKAELMPRLAFSTVSSWKEINDWYLDLIKSKDEIDSEIELKIHQLTDNLKDETEKIKAIYYCVASEIRYVGIELGSGAYQPSLASDVFLRCYGDCKDKVVLMIGMLKSIGVEAYPALISPAPHYKVDLDLPSIGQFNHLIVALPKSDEDEGDYIWLDPTSETCGYFDLPARNQDRLALIVKANGGNFVQTPFYPAEDNALVMSADLQLQADGSIHGTEKIKASGQYAIKYRAIYKSMKYQQLKYQIEKDLNARYPGAKLETVEIKWLNDLEPPLEAQSQFSGENYATKMDFALLFPIPSSGLNEYYSLASSDSEKDIIFEHPFLIKRHIKLEIPKEYRLSDLPEDIKLQWDFGKLKRKCVKKENRLEYELEFTISNKHLGSEDYSKLKQMLESLSREEKRAILLLNRANNF